MKWVCLPTVLATLVVVVHSRVLLLCIPPVVYARTTTTVVVEGEYCEVPDQSVNITRSRTVCRKEEAVADSPSVFVHYMNCFSCLTNILKTVARLAQLVRALH